MGYGMVECRGIQTDSRDSLGFLQATFNDSIRMHYLEGLLLRLQGLVQCPYPDPDESNRSFHFLYL